MQRINLLVQALHLTYCFQESPPDSLPLDENDSSESLNRSGSKLHTYQPVLFRQIGQKSASAILARELTLLPPKAAPISAPLVPTFTFHKDKLSRMGKIRPKDHHVDYSGIRATRPNPFSNVPNVPRPKT